MTFHLQPQFGKRKGTKLTCTLLLAAQFIAGAPFLEAAQASNPALGSAVKTSNADHTVTGSVKDSEGAPLAGVTIRIKNSKTGTTTKADGTFTLNAPTGKETLIISSIGYKTQEVSVADRKIINIILDSETSSLDEVVVVGYGQQKKIHLTGAVAQIDMKAIVKRWRYSSPIVRN